MTERDIVNLADLPDPDDRQLAWSNGEPAYQRWWRRLTESSSQVWEAVHHHRLLSRYAHAVPCAEAIEALAALGPLVEVGAGGGYWARLISDLGGDIRAFDISAPACNGWFESGIPWHPVELGNEQVVHDHPGRAIFVCWPERPNGFLPSLLDETSQTTLALVTDGRSTFGADPLYGRLDRGWTLQREVAIPTWPARYDQLTIWTRNVGT